MNDAFHEAICQEMAWKCPEMRAFAVELVQRAVERVSELRVESRETSRGDALNSQHELPSTDFTTDIVPDAVRGSGSGIAGSVIELLKKANVIEPVGVMVAEEWFPRRVKSTRPGRKASYLNLYRLKSVSVARAFLRRNAGGTPALPEYYEPQELVMG